MYQAYPDPAAQPQMYVPLQMLHTKNNTTSRFEWTNTNATWTTQALSLDYAGVRAKGGWHGNFYSANGTNLNVGKNSIFELQANFSFQWWDLYCRDIAGPPPPLNPGVFANVKALWEYKWTGGTRVVFFKDGYQCPNPTWRQSLAPNSELWVSRSTTYSLTNSVTYALFEMDSKQENTQTHKKVYTNTSTAVSATLCGQDGSRLIQTRSVKSRWRINGVGLRPPS